MINPLSPSYASTPFGPGRSSMSYAPLDIDAAASSPMVTVVTPFYNVGSIFHETARCVLGQSLQAFEWIIVNDASDSPESLAILGEYRALALRDPRVRVVDHVANMGLPAARNTGVRGSRSPYVFLLDADDLIEPTTLEKSALTLECNPAFAFTKGYNVGFGVQEYLWTNGFHEHTKFLQENRVTATAMIRSATLHEVGLFDETIRGGLEDWEFWLRCAEHGRWGITIPEYLDWYRRRAQTERSWTNLQSATTLGEFQSSLRVRFPSIFAGGFPAPKPDAQQAFGDVPLELGLKNRLKRDGRSVVIIAGSLQSDWLGDSLVGIAEGLARSGWRVTTVATTGDAFAMSRASLASPDVFVLDHYAQGHHHPRLLSHLITSRRADVVLLYASELAYVLLPFLHWACPNVAFADFNHASDDAWRNGGHARSGVGWAPMLDASLVASDELAQWMVRRGRDAAAIEVCRPDPRDPQALGAATSEALERAIARMYLRPTSVLDPGLVRELTIQSVELIRVQGVAEALWRRVESPPVVVPDGASSPQHTA